jgi:uncharacterized membrane protein
MNIECGKSIWLKIRFISIALVTAGSMVSLPAAAGNAGAALIGGLIGGHLITRHQEQQKEQTAALNTIAYENAQPRSAAPAPVSHSGGSSTKSVEQKLNELDTLAAKGYISKDEYKAKKKAIVDGI